MDFTIFKKRREGEAAQIAAQSPTPPEEVFGEDKGGFVAERSKEQEDVIRRSVEAALKAERDRMNEFAALAQLVPHQAASIRAMRDSGISLSEAMLALKEASDKARQELREQIDEESEKVEEFAAPIETDPASSADEKIAKKAANVAARMVK